MEIIQAPNKFISNDDKDRIFIYLGGSVKIELIDYIKNNNHTQSIKHINKIVLFNPIYDLKNKTEEEIKEYFKWEDEYIKTSDIFAMLLDNTKNNKYLYQLGFYLSFFYNIYKKDINQHFILAYTKEYKNELYLKTQVNLAVKNLIKPIEINDLSSYGDLIIEKLNELYNKTETFINHNVIHIEQEHYWSINLGPYIKKLFCQAPWPKSQFSIGIIGSYGIGKTSIYIWFNEGRFCKRYENYIGGNFSLYQVEINNKKFIVNFEDTGSQERFLCYDMMFKRLKKNSCVIFVFDITNRKSFDEIKNVIYPRIMSKENNNYFNVLIGSKLDLKFKRNITYEEADAFADDNNIKYFEVSAKSGENMEKLCNYIYNKFSKH